MNSIVVDTSALMRLYLPDGPLPDNLENQLDSAWKAGKGIPPYIIAPRSALRFARFQPNNASQGNS